MKIWQINFWGVKKEFLTDRQVWKSAAKSACDLSNGRFHTLIPSTIPLQRSFCSSIGHISQYSIQGTNCLSKENENHFCFGSFILVMMLGCNDPESRDCRSPPSSHSICPKSKRQSGSTALYWKARVTSTDRNFESFSFKSPFLTRPDLQSYCAKNSDFGRLLFSSVQAAVTCQTKLILTRGN